MGKVSRMLLTMVLSGLLLAAVAGPAAAAPRDTYDTMACWNNCGIGGTVVN